MTDLNEALLTAKEIATKAGEMMKNGFSMDIHPDWKADGTPLTETDKAINAMVIKEIEQKYPDHGVLGEEQSDDYAGKEYVWVCDPIDGTIPFSHGLQMSTFCLALVQDGQPVVSVIGDPFHSNLFWAIRNGGSFLNGRKLATSVKEDFQGAIVHVEGGSRLPKINGLYQEAGAFRLAFASYDFGAKQVATGHFVTSIFTHDNPWDCAAAKLLVDEAGGVTSDLDGNQQRYDQTLNGFVASANAKIHEQNLEMISRGK